MLVRRRRGLALLAAAVVGTSLLVPAAGASPAARPATTFPVAGLELPVRMVVDKWGVPHIYASSTQDAFLAQGFNAARDRTFQLDLWRRRGLGQLSEALGPAYAESDRAARLFLYRGDMDREWASYAPQAKAIATKFAAGINGYLDWLAGHPEALPEEFRKLNYTPARWQPEDVVRIRHHALVSNLFQEVVRGMVTCVAGPEADQVRLRLEPEHKLTVPAGLDPCALAEAGEAVLNTYAAGTQPISFDAATQRVSFAKQGPAPEGSNNWAIAPGKSATGRPILADDPHRRMSLPSSRYLAHLSAPGMDIVGAGEPMIPGLSIGHNGTAAFGLTIFPVDQEDLYVYALDPNDHSRYRYGDGWESIRTVKEQLAVKGQAPREVSLGFTRHGPVLHVDAQRHLAYGVRSVWAEPGTSPYFAALSYQTAKDSKQFNDALRTWGAPGANHVYADTKGTIAWMPGAVVPKRVGYDGLLPVPGDGRYDWNGFWRGDDLPRSVNPAKGFVATANELNLPAGYPADRQLGYDSWSDPYRAQRIVEVLSSKSKVTLDDSAKLQNDQLSIPARKITAVLGGLVTTDPAVQRSIALLRGWNHVESVDSGPAALYEVWFSRHLVPATMKALLPKVTFLSSLDTQTLIAALESPEAWFGAVGAGSSFAGGRNDQHGKAARDKLLVDTLTTARADVEKLLGADQTKWQWGALQHTLFEHPISSISDPEAQKRLNVGPFPRGGSADTVNNSGYEKKTFRQSEGASFRMVLDVGNWDAARAVNSPGQAGNPADPHYRDLAKSWQQGEYFPLLYTRAAVEANADYYLDLVPKR